METQTGKLFTKNRKAARKLKTKSSNFSIDKHYAPIYDESRYDDIVRDIKSIMKQEER